MSLTTRPLRLHLKSVLGAPLAGANVTLRLSAYQVDGLYVIPLVWTLEEDATVPGDYVGLIWPNTRGDGGTHYDMLVQANSQQLLAQMVTIGDGATETVTSAKINAPPYPAVYEAEAVVLNANLFADAAGASASLAAHYAEGLGSVSEAVATAVGAAETAGEKADLAVEAQRQYSLRNYPGDYNVDPSTRPDGSARQVGDSAQVLSGGVYVQKLFNGATWYIPNQDGQALALPGGGSLVGYQGRGVGPKPTKIDRKLAERPSIWDYMTEEEVADLMTGTPVLDHSAAIQAAYNAAAKVAGLYVTNVAGGRVHWPPGRYNASQWIHRNFVRVSGGSQHSFGGGATCAIVKQIAGSNKDLVIFERQGTSGAPNYFCGPLTMEGLALVGDFAAMGGCGMRFVDADGNALTPQDQVTIKHMSIWGFAGDAIHFPNGGNPLFVSDIVVGFVGRYGIYYRDQQNNVNGRTQITAFDRISGDACLGGALICIENTNDFAAVTITNTKVETRVNTQRGYKLAKAVCTLSGSAVSGLAITDPGEKYSSTPTVAFRGGGGTGASATAVMADGRLVGFTDFVPGSGYTTAPFIALLGGGVSGPESAAIELKSCGGAFTIIGASIISSVFNDDYSAGQLPPPVIKLSGTRIPRSIVWSALANRNHPNQVGTPSVKLFDAVNNVTINDWQGSYGSDPVIFRLNNSGRILALDGNIFRRFASYEGGAFRYGAFNNDYTADADFYVDANKGGKGFLRTNGVTRMTVAATGVTIQAGLPLNCGRIMAPDGATMRRFASFEDNTFRFGAYNNDYDSDVDLYVDANKGGKVFLRTNGVSRLVAAASGVTLQEGLPFNFGSHTSLYEGLGVPANSMGKDGDLYLRNDGTAALQNIYKRRTGTWVGIL